MLEDKINNLGEMRSLGIDTHEYVFMDQPGETTGTLMLKAENRTKSIRMFFSLSNGRKVLTPVFWWQLSRGFQNIPTGTVLKLTYVQNSTGQIHLENAVPV